MGVTIVFDALKKAEFLGSALLLGYALRDQGYILTYQNRLDEARLVYQEALSIWHTLDQQSMIMESEAGLAHVALLFKQPTQAKTHIANVTEHLIKNEGIIGASRPLYVYWVCYQVLKANQNPLSQLILTQAYHSLQETANKISEQGKQTLYLENVPFHKAIIDSYENHSSTAL